MFYSCLKCNKNGYIMATGTPDVEQIPDDKETNEECAGKKKSKFQTFKKFFAKKKRKESPAPSKESSLKPSQSSSDVSLPEPPSPAFESPSELGAKGSMGNKSLSHESVFISEPAAENTTGDRLSQENIPGKVKALQLQLQSNIRVGSPPQVITSKPCDDAGAVSEDDGLPQSPPEMSTLHELLTRSSSKTFNAVEHRSSLSLGGTDSEDEQISSESSSRAVSPLTSNLLPIDFSSPASTLGCLDNSAARHKMALNPRKHWDRIRGPKLTANIPTAREELPKLSEEESNTNQLLIVEHPDLSSEGCTAKEESTSVSRTSEQIEKADITALPEFASKPASKTADTTTLPQITIEPLSTVEETATLPELASNQLSNIADTTTLPEFTSKTTTDVAENVEEFNESPIEDVASGNVSISNVLFNIAQKQDEKEDVKEDDIASCPSRDLHSDSEVRQHNTATDDSLLVQTQQKSMEASKSQDQTSLPIVSLNGGGKGNEPTSVLAAVEGQDYFCKPADQTEDKPLHIASPAPNAVLPKTSVSEAALSIDGAQVLLCPVSPPIKNEIPIQEPTQAVISALKSATLEDQELSLAEPQKIANNEEPQNHLQTSSLADGSDLHTVSIQQIIAIPHEIVGETTSESHDKSDQILVEDVNQSRENDSGALAVAASDTEKDHVATVCTESIKTHKEIDENMKSPQKTAKPVKFTIAPAWQRSVSGGSSMKDDTGVRSPPTATIKPELFEGTAEKHEFLDTVRPPAKVFSTNTSSSVNKGAPPTPKKQNENRAEHVEIPFGVRLKKAPPFLKSSDEKSRDLQKSESSETSLVKDLPKFESPGKSLQTLSDARKHSLKHEDSREEKDSKNTRAEGVPKKPHPLRTPEKSMNKSVAARSAEPEWISVAKLKQKCFQEHPLAKEQDTTEATVGGTDAGEIQSTASEEGLRKICVPSPVAQGRTSEPLVSTAAAAVIGPSFEEKPLPAASEKGPRQTAALPVAQQSHAEPPWLSLAKKKAKAWSDMPQIVQ